jgi:hypothetical protein
MMVDDVVSLGFPSKGRWVCRDELAMKLMPTAWVDLPDERSYSMESPLAELVYAVHRSECSCLFRAELYQAVMEPASGKPHKFSDKYQPVVGSHFLLFCFDGKLCIRLRVEEPIERWERLSAWRGGRPA